MICISAIVKNKKYYAGITWRQQLIIILAITAAALFVRYLRFSFESRDYEIYFRPWIEEIRQYGGFASLGRAIGDYFPPYVYILSAISYLPINSVYAIKLVSMLGDIVLALYMYRMVAALTGARFAGNKKSSIAIAAYGVTLLLPTVILNSSIWAQCDSLYTAALVACVYYMVKKRPHAGMIAFSVAFIFKLQAIFLAPLILLLLIKKWVRIRHLVYTPIIYFLAVVPAWAAGRNLWELLTIYVKQTGSYQRLTMNAPNIYTFFNTDDTENIAGRCLAVVAFVLFLCFAKLYKTKFTLTPRLIYQFAMLCAVALPFVLPHMHERYFYLADVLAGGYALLFWRRRFGNLTSALVIPTFGGDNPASINWALGRYRWFVPLIVVGSSFLVYGMYLFDFSRWMDPAYAAAPMGYVVYVVAKDFVASIKTSG